MAKQLIEFPLADGSVVLVEVDEAEPASGTVRAGRGIGEIAAKAAQTLDAAIAKIKPVAETVVGTLRELSVRPDEVEVEFGIKLNAGAGAIIASAGAEANFRVTLTWKREK